MNESGAGKGWRRGIPSGITALRVIAVPWIFFTFRHPTPWTLGLLLLVVFTDMLDGYLARRWKVTSSSGGYWDVAADFLCILAAFCAFVLEGLYPFWILVMIVGMFVQFLLTSRQGRPVYDPVGKYYGAALFLAIGITLAFPVPGVCLVAFISLIVLTAVSVLSRIMALRPEALSRFWR